eukprot:gene20848-27681_t
MLVLAGDLAPTDRPLPGCTMAYYVTGHSRDTFTALKNFLAPMPYIFFGSSGGGYSMQSSLQSGWIDAGKFLTGFSAVGSIAIPAILAHAQVITTGALIMELAAAFVLGATCVVYDFFSKQDDDYYY